MTCFPGNPLVTDILAGCDGDANAATAKLLELRDEEQAHELAAAMQEAQELSAAPAKVRALKHQTLHPGAQVGGVNESRNAGKHTLRSLQG